MLITNNKDLTAFLLHYGLRSSCFLVTSNLSRAQSKSIDCIELLDTDSLIVKACLPKNKTSLDYGAQSVISRRIRAHHLDKYVDCDVEGQHLAEQLGLYVKVLEEAQYRELYIWVYPVTGAASHVVKLTHAAPPEVIALASIQGENNETNVI